MQSFSQMDYIHVRDIRQENKRLTTAEHFRDTRHNSNFKKTKLIVSILSYHFIIISKRKRISQFPYRHLPNCRIHLEKARYTE